MCAVIPDWLAQRAPDAVPLPGGRTNRVWRSGGRVIKLYPKGRATPLFANDPELEWRCLQLLHPLGLAPAPLERFSVPDGPVLVMAHLAGPPLADPAPVLERLHKVPPPAWLPASATGAALLDQGARMLCAQDPLRHLRPAPPTAQGAVFLHRDAVRANRIATPQGPCLIDWQSPGLGDPREDFAHAASWGMAALYGGPRLASHPEALPWHWRMACYCTWAAAQGRPGYSVARDAEIAQIETLLAEALHV